MHTHDWLLSVGSFHLHLLRSLPFALDLYLAFHPLRLLHLLLRLSQYFLYLETIHKQLTKVIFSPQIERLGSTEAGLGLRTLHMQI